MCAAPPEDTGDVADDVGGSAPPPAGKRARRGGAGETADSSAPTSAGGGDKKKKSKAAASNIRLVEAQARLLTKTHEKLHKALDRKTRETARQLGEEKKLLKKKQDEARPLCSLADLPRRATPLLPLRSIMHDHCDDVGSAAAT